jgi:diguanylate cyclase (GGDEF)-like protein
MDEDYGRNLTREHKHYKSFLTSTAIVVFIFILALFAGMGVRVKHLIEESLLQQARAHFRTILITRAWNSEYGGVYVEKLLGMKSNPYISEPDITTSDGRIFTIIPPAVMTKEISTFADTRDLYFFKITSIDPINPDNAPDDFEREALLTFQQGQKEFYGRELINNRLHFRYMAPLQVEESCVRCHLDRDYQVGDVRGGISVNIDVQHNDEELKRNFAVILVLGVMSLLVLLSVVLYFTSNLIEHINSTRKRIEEMIITDELTGIPNRRHLLARFEQEFEKAIRLGTSLGCVMLDIDKFKRVNDKYGHLVGDEVLRRFAAFLVLEGRSYDVIGRLGGEEFLVVLPATDMDETRRFAERVRQHIEDLDIVLEDSRSLRVTVSAGVTVIEEDDSSIEDLLIRSDKAMYFAKSKGRNRVC